MHSHFTECIADAFLRGALHSVGIELSLALVGWLVCECCLLLFVFRTQHGWCSVGRCPSSECDYVIVEISRHTPPVVFVPRCTMHCRPAFLSLPLVPCVGGTAQRFTDRLAARAAWKRVHWHTLSPVWTTDPAPLPFLSRAWVHHRRCRCIAFRRHLETSQQSVQLGCLRLMMAVNSRIKRPTSRPKVRCRDGFKYNTNYMCKRFYRYMHHLSLLIAFLFCLEIWDHCFVMALQLPRCHGCPSRIGWSRVFYRLWNLLSRFFIWTGNGGRLWRGSWKM